MQESAENMNEDQLNTHKKYMGSFNKVCARGCNGIIDQQNSQVNFARFKFTYHACALCCGPKNTKKQK